MTNTQRPREPMFNFTEKAPAYLAGVLIAIHAMLSIIGGGLSVGYAFGALMPWAANGISSVSHAFRLIAHGFLHGDWGHVLINSGMIIVFGIAAIRGAKLQASSKGKVSTASRDFFLIFFAGVIIGGLFQWGWWAAISEQLTALDTPYAVGASGGASALFAAGAWAIGGRDKMIQFGLGWAVINAIMVLLENFIGISIAWPAHIGGYIAGMILAPTLVKANSTNLSVL